MLHSVPSPHEDDGRRTSEQSHFECLDAEVEYSSECVASNLCRYVNCDSKNLWDVLWVHTSFADDVLILSVNDAEFHSLMLTV